LQVKNEVSTKRRLCERSEAIQHNVFLDWLRRARRLALRLAIMREDALCTKNKTAAANLALFRNFAYNILKTKDKSIKQATEIFANYNVKKLLYILLRT